MFSPPSRKSIRLWTGTRVPRKQGAPLMRCGLTHTASSSRFFLLRSHKRRISGAKQPKKTLSLPHDLQERLGRVAERAARGIHQADLAVHVHLLDEHFAQDALADFLAHAHARQER